MMTNGIPGIENIGGDLDKITGKRCTFFAFPWRWPRGRRLRAARGRRASIRSRRSIRTGVSPHVDVHRHRNTMFAKICDLGHDQMITRGNR